MDDSTKLRIRVAELCGWDWDENSAWNPVGQRHDRNHHPFANEPDGISLLPDYPNDLNACHEFEKWLLSQSKINKRETPFHHYFHELHKVCANSDEFDAPMKAENWAVTATAEQRCRAFVATMEHQL
jgi:hypothetical protein